MIRQAIFFKPVAHPVRLNLSRTSMLSTSLLIPRFQPRPTHARHEVSIKVEAPALTYKLRKLDARPPEPQRLRQPSIQEHRLDTCRSPDKNERDAFGICLSFIPPERKVHEPIYRSMHAFVPRSSHDPVPTPAPNRPEGDTSFSEALNGYLRRSNERAQQKSVRPQTAGAEPASTQIRPPLRFDSTSSVASRHSTTSVQTAGEAAGRRVWSVGAATLNGSGPAARF